MKDLRTMSSARVLLATLSVRTSARGRPYLSGFLGKARVVAFEGEADRFGNPTWDIFVAEPEPRAGPPTTHQRASGAEASTETPTSTGARPGGRYRAPLPESARARAERVSAEIAREYGGEELNDAIPF